MADDDEIDVLGDFSFNSCFAQNNQGIPSCSNREDTVHPQWLLDATETNWYDKQNSSRERSGPSRKLLGNSSVNKNNDVIIHTTWTQTERDILLKEMAKYGRDVRKLSQIIKTKTEAEVQALIEAEFGVNLEPTSLGLEKYEDLEDVPSVVQEEVVADDTNVQQPFKVTSSSSLPKHPFRKRVYNVSKKSLLKPNILKDDPESNHPAEIFYEDDLIIGSTESIGSEMDLTDIVSNSILRHQAKIKTEKKIGNHRRKVSRNYDKSKPRTSSKDSLKSPQARQRKDSGLSDDSVKSPKMQIILGSGQALPLSEGEQVIKIEKKKDSEPESDIEIDVDSDTEEKPRKIVEPPVLETKPTVEEPIAVPLRKLELVTRRKKKINLDGGGGYTITHTEAGDLYEVASEPRKERQPRKQPIYLMPCKVYNAERPAPFSVRLLVSALIAMDFHAHTSRGEVSGLLGGARGRHVELRHYRPTPAAAGATHCDIDPVSQIIASEQITALGLEVCGWHHSHPAFPAAPSAQDLRSQRALQALEWSGACLGLITSQHWPAGRTATHYRCFRVEDDPESQAPAGYQLRVRLAADVTAASVPRLLAELAAILRAHGDANAHSVRMDTDVCPQAKMTYLEKFISSTTHHMQSAGYSASDPLVARLARGARDVFR